jgi:hypothetical protein
MDRPSLNLNSYFWGQISFLTISVNKNSYYSKIINYVVVIELYQHFHGSV